MNYLPALKNAVQNLEEKKFYDVAIMYLTQLGYRELSVVDGAGDGGRDVICSRPELRIQLSVRRDWEKKINEEAQLTADKGLSHLIYVTNKIISPEKEQAFLLSEFKRAGDVEVSIHDLRRIVTSLAQPGSVRAAYAMLGMAIPSHLEASVRDVALSTLVLFSDEARELKDQVVESVVRAFLFKNPGASEKDVPGAVAELIPGIEVDRAATSALSRLRVAKRVVGPAATPKLSNAEVAVMEATESRFATEKAADIERIRLASGMSADDSKHLLELSSSLMARGRSLDGQGPTEESIRLFLAEKGLSRRKRAVFDALAGASVAQLTQFGSTVDPIFSANTFDIYRALGRRTDLTMLLDSSVAMPMIFGLEFSAARSRYGLAAVALSEACRAHAIRMAVPQAYINEMAAHGEKALEYLEVYNALPPEAREPLRASKNAYISHFTSIATAQREIGVELSLEDFLANFGIVKGRSIAKIENKISSLLDDHSIARVPDVRWDQEVFNRVAAEKPFEVPILVKHDAAVCTLMLNDDEAGYVFATWDNAMIELVENVARVYADTPGKVIDFLSMARGVSFETDHSVDLLSTLLHLDEKPVQSLAEKIMELSNAEQAFQLRKMVGDWRQQSPDRVLKISDVAPLLDYPAEPGA